jgi:SAM-dependent methyltransferase
MAMREAWEREAENWVKWAREPGHDSYWTFHRDIFRSLLPASAGKTLDVGCGEGRLPRDLKSWGYDVVGVDGSETMIGYAREADPAGEYITTDAATLPFPDRAFELVTAFMSLHDVDDFATAVREIARVLAPGGQLCAALTHPFSTAGEFDGSDRQAPFVVRESYFEPRRVGGKPYVRGGLQMTFNSMHRPLQAYLDALADVGMVVERVIETGDMTDPPGDRWRRMPMFLDFRARKFG